MKKNTMSYCGILMIVACATFANVLAAELIELRVSNVSAGCRLSPENGAIQPRPPLHYFCESL